MENIEILLAEGKQAAEQATTTQDLDQVTCFSIWVRKVILPSY